MPKKPHYHLQDETVTISKQEYSDLTNDKSYIADEEIQKMISTLQSVVDKLVRWYHK
jgi:hypothetical protein